MKPRDNKDARRGSNLVRERGGMIVVAEKAISRLETADDKQSQVLACARSWGASDIE
jgi:hypothetical protein